jgi:hypothetical protein
MLKNLRDALKWVMVVLLTLSLALPTFPPYAEESLPDEPSQTELPDDATPPDEESQTDAPDSEVVAPAKDDPQPKSKKKVKPLATNEHFINIPRYEGSRNISLDGLNSSNVVRSYTANSSIAIYEMENRVNYDFGDVLTYTRDGLVPAFMEEVNDSGSDYGMWKLRDNWYYVFIP